MALVEDPFAIAKDAVDAPMNEHAELHVLKFAASLQVLWRRLILALGGSGRCENAGG
jgi:hypothetical protein